MKINITWLLFFLFTSVFFLCVPASKITISKPELNKLTAKQLKVNYAQKIQY